MIIMRMRWEGLTAEQYDQARDKVAWEVDPPEGGLYHVAWFDDGALNVVDVWDNPDDLQSFVDTRLMPAAKGDLGLPGEPDVSVHPLHRYWDAVHREARN